MKFLNTLVLTLLLLASWASCAQKNVPNKAAAAPTTPKKDYDTKQWTEIKDLDTTVALDIRYATTNNFTKAKMYDCPRCFFRPEVAKALVKVHNSLKTKGYGGLKMFDCYRPRPYQQRLWDKVPDARYVTPPVKGSMHGRGAAADLTVVDKNGKELDMGTPFDDFSEKAHSDNQDLPKTVLQNRALLRKAMEAEGFKVIRTEWWHFSYARDSFELSSWVWKCAK
jgi:zinc D-Ala-D-Ala dipeptidase